MDCDPRGCFRDWVREGVEEVEKKGGDRERGRESIPKNGEVLIR